MAKTMCPGQDAFVQRVGAVHIQRLALEQNLCVWREALLIIV